MTMTEKWRIGLHSVKQRIWLTYPFDANGKIRDALKTRVQGCRWDSKEKLWHFPLDWQVALDIRLVARSFGAGLAVEPELARWAKRERDRRNSIISPDKINIDTSQMLPNCRRNYPHMIKAMEEMPWQIPGAQFIYEQRSVLIADEPGLGKTIQTLAATAEANITGPIIVIAPKSAVAVTWPDEIRQWLGEQELVIPVNTDLKPEDRSAMVTAVKMRVRNYPNERIWVICGPNYLRIRADLDSYGNYLRDSHGRKCIYTVNEAIPELFDINWSSIIVDESHQTLATSKGDRKKWSAQRLGLCSLSVPPGGYRIAMSGTPFRGKTENIWGTLNYLKPDKYTSYWNFVNRHYGVLDTYAIGGSSIVKGDEIIDEKRFYNELRSIMIRRTKAEVAPWLPPKRYGGTHLNPQDDTSPVAVWLPLTDKQRKQYKEIEDEALLHLDVDEITVNGVLAEMTRFKQIAISCLGTYGRPDGGNRRHYKISGDIAPIFPSNKFEWIKDFIQDRKSAGTKVIVASQFTSFLNLMSGELDGLGFSHYLFTGDTSNKDRARIKREFQSEKGEMLILLNTMSGGTSLTMDAADDVVMVDQTWIPDDQTQVEDRAHRISRVHNVVIWNLCSLGTIDEDIAILNNERLIETSIIDTQRGVNYVKQLVAMGKKRAGVRT
jgi:SNF2 family DNA or RNA helicase